MMKRKREKSIQLNSHIPFLLYTILAHFITHKLMSFHFYH